MPPKESSLEFVRRKSLFLLNLIHYYFIAFKTLLSTFLLSIMSTEAAQRDLTNGLKNVDPEPIDPEKVAAPRNEKVSADAAKEDIKPNGDAEEDAAKIAKKMSGIIDPAIDRLKPILQMITEVSTLPLHYLPFQVLV